ncbi:DUF924 family protein [Microbulbifer sp. CnH-101-G]|uniref:DUF924 family protein n=1 Tax=Microbulbifer sp. CnH-101-G TaxID=3243393 RepID=UPI00403A1495
MPDIKEILTFWFGDPSLDHRPTEELQKRWFSADQNLDRQMAEDFAEITNLAIEGKLDHWRQSLMGELALLLLCDQFARNIHRGTHLAFKGDDLALEISETILQRGDEQKLGLFQQVFVGMPLEHSEKHSIQQRSVAYFAQLQKQYGDDEAIAPYLATHYRYALAHQEIIEQFGRFPHRNAALGRDSTEDEKYWLAQGGGFK